MKPCWAQYLLWLIIVLAGATAMLSGCGQDGNLYLPDKEQPKDQDLDLDQEQEPDLDLDD